jgi:hypothetical protein
LWKNSKWKTNCYAYLLIPKIRKPQYNLNSSPKPQWCIIRIMVILPLLWLAERESLDGDAKWVERPGLWISDDRCHILPFLWSDTG